MDTDTEISTALYRINNYFDPILIWKSFWIDGRFWIGRDVLSFLSSVPSCMFSPRDVLFVVFLSSPCSLLLPVTQFLIGAIENSTDPWMHLTNSDLTIIPSVGRIVIFHQEAKITSLSHLLLFLDSLPPSHSWWATQAMGMPWPGW